VELVAVALDDESQPATARHPANGTAAEGLVESGSTDRTPQLGVGRTPPRRRIAVMMSIAAARPTPGGLRCGHPQPTERG
jgi:hypothetical protein